MPKYLVTIKLPKDPNHNPRKKKTGPCPASGQPCTDVTGEHHTLIAKHYSRDIGEVLNWARDRFQKLEDHVLVTRVEQVP